ncbi:DUF6505 family protein [Methylorubrum extorquens]|uniref:Uncharacterized protein n=1 Tax=Methylorubrum extorquens TaxID=408 RepID=A0AAX3WJ10_METEX|nr:MULTISPECIES: DUF6505 family protein [Methylobacteriaceae]KQO92563.1 hypothetical protein ASF33_16660 [Methylobacterium sp. Leaf92]KQQ20363.1 hypothetical protein ASF56_20905 [Methylobacterium sp. Leaf122]WHQ70413.1 hypothetical protein KEC54_01825 [Methylorubrum extorquens]
MSAGKLPRTLRLDPSDTFVFARAAEAGEWAVTGSFLFFDADLSALAGKERAAFRSGFVGVRSLGFSTLVVVSEASEAERETAIEDLARHIHERFGAPDREAARAAAREEIEVAASLCNLPVGSVVAMHRSAQDGEIAEEFRTLHQRAPGADPMHGRAFHFVETDEDGPDEQADLVGLLSDASAGAERA